MSIYSRIRPGRGPARRRPRGVRPSLEGLEPRALLTRFGTLAEFPVPTAGSQPRGITAGPDGNLWFTESAANKIGHITPQGGMLPELIVPTAGSMPYSIANGADANGQDTLYFTEYQGGKLGQITLINSQATITEGPVVDRNQNPVPGTHLVDLATIAPGFARVTQQNSGVVTLFSITGPTPVNVPPNPSYPPPMSSTGNSGNSGTVIDAEFNVYFAERNADKIAVYSVDKRTGLGRTTEYALTKGSRPLSMTLGPDGNVWFTEFGRGMIGKFNVATHAVTEYSTGSSRSEPWGIVASPGGFLYFTTYRGNTIGQISVGGQIRQDTLPNPNSGPRGITIGPDGNPWFVEGNGNRVAQYNVQFAVFNTPTNHAQLYGITAGPDGNVWVAEQSPNNVARITPGGQITEFSIPDPGRPFGITTGPDHNVWVTLWDDYKLARITPSGQVTGLFHLLNGDFGPVWVTSGPNGNLWYTTANGFLYYQGNVDQMTTAGVPIRGPVVSALSHGALTRGPDGNMWFTSYQLFSSKSYQIGRVRPDGTGLKLFTVPLKKFAELMPGITAGPDGNVWFTTARDGEVGRITPGGRVTLFPAPPGSWPNRIVTGPDKNLWFTDLLRNSVLYRMTTNGTVTEFFVPGVNSPLEDITMGPDKNIWATSQYTSQIVEVLVRNIPPAGTPTEDYLRAAYRRQTGAEISADRLARLGGLVKLVPPDGSKGPPVPGPHARQVLARAILSGPDYQARMVRELYLATLSRLARPAEVSSGVLYLRRGGSITGLREQTLASDEYFLTRGQHQNAGFVRALAQDVLRRPPTRCELLIWGHMLRQDSSRRDVASLLLRQPEALGVQVDLVYRRLLHRAPNRAELRSGVAALTHGARIEALTLALVTSAEFFRNVQ